MVNDNKVARYRQVVASLKEKIPAAEATGTKANSHGHSPTGGRHSRPRSNEPRGRERSRERSPSSRDGRRRSRSCERSGHRRTAAGSPSRRGRTPSSGGAAHTTTPSRQQSPRRAAYMQGYAGSPMASGGGAGAAAAETGAHGIGQGGADVNGRVPGGLVGALAAAGDAGAEALRASGAWPGVSSPGVRGGMIGAPSGGLGWDSSAAVHGVQRGMLAMSETVCMGPTGGAAYSLGVAAIGGPAAAKGGGIPAGRTEDTWRGQPAVGHTVHGAAAGEALGANGSLASGMAAGWGAAVGGGGDGSYLLTIAQERMELVKAKFGADSPQAGVMERFFLTPGASMKNACHFMDKKNIELLADELNASDYQVQGIIDMMLQDDPERRRPNFYFTEIRRRLHPGQRGSRGRRSGKRR